LLSITTIDFELDVAVLLRFVKQKRTYVPPSKYPPVVEDLSIIAPDNVFTGDLLKTILTQSKLIVSVSLLDKYKDTRTFHVIFQSNEKNLTAAEITPLREKILKTLNDKYGARLKS
jgi:phenylalanyl-tRNA synthetase beta chain